MNKAAMEWFVHVENLKHYRALLDRTIDDSKRVILLKLLAEEEGKTDHDEEAKAEQPSDDIGN